MAGVTTCVTSPEHIVLIWIGYMRVNLDANVSTRFGHERLNYGHSHQGFIYHFSVE